MLDTVPDSVVIFSKSTEQHSAKVLYANRRVNTFFGENIKIESQLSTERKNKNSANRFKRTGPLKNRIFQDFEVDVCIDNDSVNKLSESNFYKSIHASSSVQKLSLMDIVIQKQLQQEQIYAESETGHNNGVSTQQTYLVSKPANKYETTNENEDGEEEEKAPGVVLIRIMDVLFNDQMCSLIYIKELNSDQNNNTTAKQ